MSNKFQKPSDNRLDTHCLLHSQKIPAIKNMNHNILSFFQKMAKSNIKKPEKPTSPAVKIYGMKSCTLIVYKIVALKSIFLVQLIRARPYIT
jgi:hypothetical protein